MRFWTRPCAVIQCNRVLISYQIMSSLHEKCSSCTSHFSGYFLPSTHILIIRLPFFRSLIHGRQTRLFRFYDTFENIKPVASIWRTAVYFWIATVWWKQIDHNYCFQRILPLYSFQNELPLFPLQKQWWGNSSIVVRQIAIMIVYFVLFLLSQAGRKTKRLSSSEIHRMSSVLNFHCIRSSATGNGHHG